MKRTLMAAAILGSLSSLPAQAQWGGLGEDDWGWKEKVCHLCLTAIEFTVLGGKGSSDDGFYRDTEQNGVQMSQDAEHYQAQLRIGLGPRLFLDASYRTVETTGDSSDFEIERSFTQLSYGGGVFLVHEPAIGAIYLRGGGISLKEDGDLTLKEGSGLSESGASTGFDADSVSDFGGSVGGFWNRGSTRLEASYGVYGDVREGNIELSYAFNQRLFFVLGASMVDLENRGGFVRTVGNTETESRSVTYLPYEEDAMTLYGLGLRLRF